MNREEKEFRATMISMDKGQFEIVDAPAGSWYVFNAKHKDSSGRVIAWIHGSMSETDGLSSYLLNVRDIGKLDEQANPLYEAVCSHYGIEVPKDSGLKTPVNSHPFDWGTGEPGKAWMVEGRLLDFYQSGFDGNLNYPMSIISKGSLREAHSTLYSRMSGYVHPQFRGELVLRNIEGDVLKFVHQGSMTVNSTEFMETGMAVDDYGLLLHVPLNYVEEAANILRAPFPEGWDEKRKRISHSLYAALANGNIRDNEAAKLLDFRLGGTTLNEIIGETGEFPSQEMFSAVAKVWALFYWPD